MSFYELTKAMLSDVAKDLGNLHDFAVKMGEFYDKQLPSLLPIEMKLKQEKAICLICNKQCQMYTSKNDNTYLANEDRSPHRKGLDCKNNWDEYNGK